MTTFPTTDYKILGDAVRSISARCDGAQNDDGVGFSATDTTFGKSIAMLPDSEWDIDVASAVYDLLRHYKRQLTEVGIPFDSIPVIDRTINARRGRSKAIRLASDALAVDAVSRKSKMELEGNEIVLHSPFHAELVRDLRGVQGRRWDSSRSVNVFPAVASQTIRDIADKWHIAIPENIATLESVPVVEQEPEVGLQVDDEDVIIRFAYDRALVEDVKRSVPAARWNVQKRVWTTVVANLHQALLFAQRHNLAIQPGLTEYLETERARAEELREASVATDADIEVASAIPLLPYQRAGVAYALKTRRLMIADSMGLGKTVQALAAVVTANALPAVVITTSTLKLNWQLEVSKFFPSLTTTVVSGTASGEIPEADIVILNYDICAQRADDVISISPQALVVDESHAIKNAKAKYVCPECNSKVRVNAKRCSGCNARFSAPVEKWTVRRGEGVMRISRAIPNDGMVILLSGTPITNRPSELVPQLVAIGRIDEFGGPWRFQQRYCGRDGSGATNLKELNEKMRGSFFIRRTVADVLDELPELRNSQQMMPVSSAAMRRYTEIENDVVHYLANRAKEIAESEAAEVAVRALGVEISDASEQASVRAAGRRAYVEKAMRAEAAEHLVRISVLKNAVAELKYESMVAWIEDFLNESDEKLIVFAEHVEMVENIVSHFGDITVKIRGGVSQEDRMEAVRRFQEDPATRLFVGNMAAASEGITLTAASNVAFLEQAWTPTMHAQCVSRAYARANDPHPCTAWYLLAPNTIDMEINSLLAKKAEVVNAATDGIEIEKQGSILADLVVSLASRQERNAA